MLKYMVAFLNNNLSVYGILKQEFNVYDSADKRGLLLCPSSTNNAIRSEMR